ncbi:pyrimidine 5-nucleotidase [Multifurca ochricompacta]|uniref:Pyrimidine 5-nucleotidase n=1 Tax=Multifurca ochricompacta TaxID=376703 RepID=A0AAD4MBW7_9AGAM|nr:pyrimidine 5-nucleotidase [Multifurca ochricompacta]
MAIEHTYDDRLVAFLDIDNTLYSKSFKIAQEMGVRIHAYFVSLGLSDEEASKLHLQYYTQYGLALRGLRRHYGVDPIDFNDKCDGSIPLEDILKPDPRLRQLLQDIDRSKCRVWALTNAYDTHAERVLKILNLRDQIEGVVFCDYLEEDFDCKPEPTFYLQAMQKAGVRDPTKCLFVDDSLGNVEGAKNVGWLRCVHFRETEAVEALCIKHTSEDQEKLLGENEIIVIEDLQQLRDVWSDVFVQTEN